MKYLSIIFFLAITHALMAQSQTTKAVQWITFEEAMQKNKTTPKPILIDMYTDWCGWCKKMDANTFSDSAIASYINEKFYAVKFDAETTDEISYKDSVYKNVNKGQLDANGRPVRRKSHSLAEKLLNGRLSYPTIVYMVEEKNIIAPVPGYYTPENIEPILLYFGEEIYNLNLFEAFSKGMNVDGILKE